MSLYFHSELNSLSGGIDTEYLYIDDISDAHNFQRMFDIFLLHLRNVHQAVLMDADVHKYAEVDDVAHGARELRARL